MSDPTTHYTHLLEVGNPFTLCCNLRWNDFAPALNSRTGDPDKVTCPGGSTTASGQTAHLIAEGTLGEPDEDRFALCCNRRLAELPRQLHVFTYEAEGVTCPEFSPKRAPGTLVHLTGFGSDESICCGQSLVDLRRRGERTSRNSRVVNCPGRISTDSVTSATVDITPVTVTSDPVTRPDQKEARRMALDYSCRLVDRSFITHDQLLPKATEIEEWLMRD